MPGAVRSCFREKKRERERLVSEHSAGRKLVRGPVVCTIWGPANDWRLAARGSLALVGRYAVKRLG